MADATLEIVRGSADSWTLTLLDDTATAITGSFTGSESLSAEVWRGDDTAALFSPTVTWLSATNGTVTLAVSASDSGTLTPFARYPVVLTVGSRKVRVGVLVASPGPGSAAVGAVYGSLDGMMRLTGEKVADLLESSDLGDGNELLAEARRITDRTVLSRARVILADQLRRHAPVVESEGITPTTGADAGPWWGPSIYPDTTVRDQLDALDALLVANNLVTTGTQNAAVVAANNHLALSELFVRQTGGGETDQKYRGLSAYHRRMGLNLLAGCVFRIDTDADGVADYEIPLV